MDNDTVYNSLNLLGFLVYLLGVRIPDLPPSEGYFEALGLSISEKISHEILRCSQN